MPSRAPKTAFVIPTLGGGGAERVVSRLVAELSQQMAVDVITFDLRGKCYDFGENIIDLNMPSQSGILGKIVTQRRRVRALKELFKTSDYSDTISFMEAASIPTIIARKLSGTSTRLTVSIRVHINFVPLYSQLQAALLYRYADRLVVPAKAMVKSSSSRLAIGSRRFRVISNPLDSDFIDRDTVPYESRTSDLILGCGRLDRQKGFDILINAVSLSSRLRKAQYVILGDGPEKSTLEKQAKSLGLSNTFTFVGRSESVRDWMDKAAIFVFPSRFEGFPNALSEAMARGCPVVAASCLSGPEEMIRHGESGLLVPPGDSVRLSSALERMLSDRELGESCGRQARITAGRWRISDIARQWVS